MSWLTFFVVFPYALTGTWGRISRSQLSVALGRNDIIVKNGTYKIGGLFAAHSSYNRTSRSCLGYNLAGMIYIQAMMYAIENVNPLNRHGDNLGYEIVDDCYGIDRAMEASARFLMGDTVKKRRMWILKYKNERNRTNSIGNVESPVLAVVGAANSDMSTAVASLLSVNSIPQISYSATSPELSDKTRYPSFLRTIPPDDAQVAAMGDLVKYFNWTWIAVIATDDSYGRFALQGLKDVLHKKGICLAAERLIDSRVTRESVNGALDHLLSTSVIRRAQVIILICAGVRVTRFFDVVQERNFTGRTWIASESWGFRSFNGTRYRNILKGSLGLRVDSHQPHKFKDYFLKNLTFKDSNRWLQKYLNDAPLLPNGSWPLNSTRLLAAHPGWLTRGDLFRDPSFLNLFSQVPQVIDAVLAISNSLKPLLKQRIRPSGFLLLENLYKLKFISSSGEEKAFDNKGDIIGGYLITNLKNRKGNTVPFAVNKTLEFCPVGLWNGSSWTSDSIFNPDPEWNRLEIKLSKIIWPKGARTIPHSDCYDECQVGTYKIFATQQCCWTCARCPEDTFTNTTGLLRCIKCPHGMVSNSNHTRCIYVDSYIDWKSPGELVVLSIAGLGFVSVSVVLVIFLIHRRTPVVVCSNAALTFALLGLLEGAFVLPFLFVLRPSPALCSSESLLFGVVFSTITAIFLVKTRHVLQIFTAKLSDTLYLVNQRGVQRRELWQSAAFAAVALAFALPYLAVSPPTPVAHQADCGYQWRILQIVNMCYIAVLSVAATYVAFRARNLPENYNEANNISITTLILIIVWVACLPSYYRVSVEQRTLILSLAIDAAAFFVLFLMFIPKVYIIYFEPQKNTPVYVSKMNMIHIWKQHSKQEMKEKRKTERRQKSEVHSNPTDMSVVPERKVRKSLPDIVPATDRRGKNEPKLLALRRL